MSDQLGSSEIDRELMGDEVSDLSDNDCGSNTRYFTPPMSDSGGPDTDEDSDIGETANNTHTNQGLTSCDLKMGERSQVPCIVIEDDDDVILVEDENEKPSSSTYSGGMPRPKKTDYELEMDLLQTLLDTGERVPIKYKLFFSLESFGDKGMGSVA
ncbi:hypothetical protein J6590_053706 [Homalodisca vitripennis]|nr:hypothetical protein J6590_053706 [Homalodisca vitripennis]